MTLLNQIRVYSGKEVLNEGAQSMTDKAKKEIENRKKAKKPVTLEDFKPVVEKMKGWSTEKINDWIEAHRKGTKANTESNYVPWSDESLDMLKKALEEYGFDFKAGEVDSRNFSPANRRKIGSNAYAYQDKINNKNAAKVSVLKVLGTLGWKDGNNGLSITGIPKTLHTEEEIKAVLKKEIENLTAVIAQSKDKNSQDIDICKKFLTEFKSIYEDEDFDKTPEDVKGYNEWKAALDKYLQTKSSEDKKALQKFNTKDVKPNKSIFEDLWSLYTSQYHSQGRTLVGVSKDTETRDFGDGIKKEVSTPKWISNPGSGKREEETSFARDIIPPDGRGLAKDIGPDSVRAIQTDKEELVKIYSDIITFLKKNKIDLDRLRDPNYKDEGYEGGDEENDELMDKLDELLKTTQADYKKLFRDVKTYWGQKKGLNIPDLDESHWLTADEIRGAVSAAEKVYANASEEGKKKIQQDVKNMRSNLEAARKSDVVNKLREQKKSGELGARRADRSETFKSNSVTQVLKKDIEKVFGPMQKYYYLALVKGNNESKVYLGDDNKIYILNKRNGQFMQMTYPNKMVDKHTDKEFLAKYKDVLEAIKSKASIETNKYFNY